MTKACFLQSLTGCADLEDLGICAPNCQHVAAAAKQQAFPSFLQPEAVGPAAATCLHHVPAVVQPPSAASEDTDNGYLLTGGPG